MQREDSGIVFSGTGWRKSRYSNPSGSCVELTWSSAPVRRSPTAGACRTGGETDGLPGAGQAVDIATET